MRSTIRREPRSSPRGRYGSGPMGRDEQGQDLSASIIQRKDGAACEPCADQQMLPDIGRFHPGDRGGRTPPHGVWDPACMPRVPVTPRVSCALPSCSAIPQPAASARWTSTGSLIRCHRVECGEWVIRVWSRVRPSSSLRGGPGNRSITTSTVRNQERVPCRTSVHARRRTWSGCMGSEWTAFHHGRFPVLLCQPGRTLCG
jgi:hypothetical protein